MKVSIIIIKIIFVLYFIACIGTEIWYLVSLHKIGVMVMIPSIIYSYILLLVFWLVLYSIFLKFLLIAILAIMYQKILKLRAEEDL
ncbi:unnamed protein product [Rhizophagus irregularis]|uniref:Uncharacterized protein n=1 Tax=Rhizophagus irregularis TaxID=588596 RepID=A0A915YRD1_9GLOM|nr:unnamed protein product [Rhizophagus irregularis]CAB5197628.1 unnamed protein product [Rhizophagus irregularis]CAB5312542.1 unnamed protein product [Rhizophagus irregularis]